MPVLPNELSYIHTSHRGGGTEPANTQALILVCTELPRSWDSLKHRARLCRVYSSSHDSETQACLAEAPARTELFPQTILHPDGATLPSKICQVTHNLPDATHILNDIFHQQTSRGSPHHPLPRCHILITLRAQAG